MFGAIATARLAATCTAVARMSGIRRPARSLHGPTTSCPRPNPTAVAVSVSWMSALETSSSLSSAGNAGRYRSTVNGPSAVSAPSTRM
jgi:cell division septation protein DedD